jgi:TetR/AcrR family transcriptional regulator, transcriptional repressor for nem operon
MAKPNVREKLLEAGAQVLFAQGFNATGVQEIADAAGAPKGSFYNHFESKDAFAVEVIDRHWQQNKVIGILSDVSRGDAQLRLRLYFETLIKARRKANFSNGCLIGNFATELADQSKPVRDRLASVFAGWSRSLAICIREGQEAGLMNADIPAEALANFLINAWEGAVMRAKVDRDDSAMRQFLTIAFDRILS